MPIGWSVCVEVEGWERKNGGLGFVGGNLGGEEKVRLTLGPGARWPKARIDDCCRGVEGRSVE